ncbi:MAG: hypothetical protein AB8H47_14700 [Bacteroidia bacterium]
MSLGLWIYLTSNSGICNLVVFHQEEGFAQQNGESVITIER